MFFAIEKGTKSVYLNSVPPFAYLRDSPRGVWRPPRELHLRCAAATRRTFRSIVMARPFCLRVFAFPFGAPAALPTSGISPGPLIRLLIQLLQPAENTSSASLFSYVAILPWKPFSCQEIFRSDGGFSQFFQRYPLPLCAKQPYVLSPVLRSCSPLRGQKMHDMMGLRKKTRDRSGVPGPGLRAAKKNCGGERHETDRDH